MRYLKQWLIQRKLMLKLIGKKNKITRYQKNSQENEKKQKDNLNPQIQNSQYVFGKDIYNYNLSHDINKSNKKIHIFIN